jgi:hypothetical protein
LQLEKRKVHALKKNDFVNAVCLVAAGGGFCTQRKEKAASGVHTVEKAMTEMQAIGSRSMTKRSIKGTE